MQKRKDEFLCKFKDEDTDLREYFTKFYDSVFVSEYFEDKITYKDFFDNLLSISDNLFFIVDLNALKIQFFGSSKEQYKFNNSVYDIPPMDSIRELGLFLDKDIHCLYKIIENSKKGISGSCDVSLVDIDSKVHPYNVFYKPIKKDSDAYDFIIGKASDVNDKKKLEMRSKTDMLTGCLNKVTTELMIEQVLDETPLSEHCLLIIDIDNFKGLNDNLGHHFGDLVLTEIGNGLKSCFRTNDIVGRIGGDEFAVLISDVESKEIIESKAKRICEIFEKEYAGEYNNYKITGSVGIARYPIDGQSFKDLYMAADKALYQSKLSGKNRYTFYTKDLLGGTMKNRTIFENASRIANSYFDAKLVGTVFNLMYESHDIRSSVNAVMKYLGESLKVDRCYIFETFDEGKSYDNTYEWCAEGIRPEIDNLKDLSAEILGDFFRDASAEGVIYSNDLTVLKAEGAYELMAEQDIKSFLHTQVIANGYVRLFLGVDACLQPRVWTEKEINSLLYSSKVLSTFLSFMIEKEKSKN